MNQTMGEPNRGEPIVKVSRILGDVGKLQRIQRMSLFAAWGLAFLLVFCPRLDAQPQSQSTQGQSAKNSSSTADVSGLAEENLDRVAAKASDIEAILKNEPGLMVDLKRLVAKQATENGQIVSDADLTDDALFARLETDVQFRAKATRLLQQYGYLEPKPNPGSPAAQEQALLIQEHLRFMQAKLQAEEQQEMPSQGEKAGSFATKSNQPQQEEGQPRLQTGTTPSAPDWLNAPQPGVATPAIDTLPLPTRNPSEVLTQASLGTSEQLPSASSEPSLAWINSGVSTQNEKTAMASELRERSASPEIEPEANRSGNVEAPVQPEMVRETNPYAGIPSLFDMYEKVLPPPGRLMRFGMNIFDNGAPRSNLLPTDLPAGPNYVVGPGDGLTIDTWGSVSQRLYRVVDREGRLSLPEVGPVLVSGRNLGEVQQQIQQTLRTQYRDISADVSIARLRTVRVYVVGDLEHPGAYDLSSLSTPLNALMQAGGPTSKGSLRLLRHYRGNELVQDVDVYDLLLHGVRSGIERLEDGDTVLVPPIGPEVTVEGMVRRPARYELKGESSLADVLELAGGILPAAALSHIEIQRIIAHEQRTMLSLDISNTQDSQQVEKQLEAFNIQGGDVVNIFPIAPYNEDAIYLEGHVLRPGEYSYHQGMKLTDVVASYKDLMPEPAKNYAEIIRLNAPDYHPSVEEFNLEDALAHPDAAPKLEPMDTIRIFSRFDFANAPVVSVGGAVRQPGTFQTAGRITLSDAVHLAGGVTPDALLADAQVYRHLPNSELKVMDVNLAGALSGSASDNILLEPRDRIVVHQNPAKVDPPSVYVRGEVANPGRYPLSADLHVGDAIHLAGGFKRSADTANADLTRYVVQNQTQLIGEHKEISLAAALAGDSNQDLALRDGDVLTIREVPGWHDIGAAVTVRGEVKHPGTYGIRPGERLSSVLERAGGFVPTAYPAGSVLESQTVKELQQSSRERLIEQIRQDASNVKAEFNATAQERSDLQQASLQQHQQEIQALEQAPVTGRMVIRLKSDLARFRNTSDDVELRNGDSLIVPKRPDFVLVTGQVYNSNAITYVPGRNAGWYMAQAGGPTGLANKKAVFIIRANGAVITGRGEGWWSGSALSSGIEPGDTIVVPEKPVGGSATWKSLLTLAQIAQAGAVSALVVTR